MQDIESMGIFGERRLRAQNQQALKCPRCDSLNTKFCYYNNYNLSQPRHFCKSCRRYWTRGGVLRNVPVGGGCRKAKRSSKPKQTKSSTGEPAASAPPSSSHDIAPPQASGSGIFSETPSFITSSSDPLLYGLDDISQHTLDDHAKIGGGLLDHTAQPDFPDGGLFGPLDWATTGPDQAAALFDLPNTYWAHTQWNDQDRSHLYLP